MSSNVARLMLLRARYLSSSSLATGVLSIAVLLAAPTDAFAKKKPWYKRAAVVVVGAATGGVGGAVLGGVIANNEKETQRLAQHAGREIKNAGNNVVEAGTTLTKVPERIAQSTEQIGNQVIRQVKEGKFVDAYYTAYFSQLRTTDRVASKSVMESSLLGTAAGVAAGAFGGPGGAAAFSGWYAYHATDGDPEATAKSVVIGGATNFAGGTMAKAGGGDVAMKMAIGAGVGAGAAIAVGAKGNAIRDAAFLGAAMVGVQETYRAATTFELEPRSSQGDAYCKADACYSTTYKGNDLAPRSNSRGAWEVDMTKVDRSRPHVGKFSGPDDSWVTRNVVGEKSPFMTAISRVPGMNQMAVLHDGWSQSWHMPMGVNEGTILPATVFTYLGTSSPLTNHLTKPIVEESRSERED